MTEPIKDGETQLWKRPEEKWPIDNPAGDSFEFVLGAVAGSI